MLEEIFDLKALSQNVFVGAVGFLLGVLATRIREWWRVTRARTRFEYDRIRNTAPSAAVVLDSAVPEFIVDAASIVDSGIHSGFYLSPDPTFIPSPRSAKLKAEHRYARADDFFGIANPMEEIARVTGISNIGDFIEAARTIESEKFSLRADGRLFNSGKIGVRRINFDRRGDEEVSRLDINIYRTDYFTHRVMQAVVKRLSEDGILSFADLHNKVHHINQHYYPFTTSLGLNVFLLTDHAKRIVFTRRSANTIDGTTSAPMHVSMNEGFSVTDFDKRKMGAGAVTVENCYRRGMREELGFVEYERRLSRLHVYDLLVAMPQLQIGLFGWASFDGVAEEIKSFRAQDRALEVEKIEELPFDSETMADVLGRSDVISYMKVGLANLCKIRGMATEEFRPKPFHYAWLFIKVATRPILRAMRLIR